MKDADDATKKSVLCVGSILKKPNLIFRIKVKHAVRGSVARARNARRGGASPMFFECDFRPLTPGNVGRERDGEEHGITSYG